MEIPLNNFDLPLFSNTYFQYINMQEFNNFHDFKNEIADEIIS